LQQDDAHQGHGQQKMNDEDDRKDVHVHTKNVKPPKRSARGRRLFSGRPRAP
jgi:hypothetical protein